MKTKTQPAFRIQHSPEAIFALAFLTLAAPGAFAAVQYLITDLGTLGGTSSYANAINNHGQVVGYSYLDNGYFHAFLFGGGIMSDLGTLGGSSSDATGINDDGHVTGYADTTDDNPHGFLCAGGTMTELGGAFCYASAINNPGQVTGNAYITNGYQAFLYSGGTMTNLGTLGGQMSAGTAINDNGQVAGNAAIASGARHAFLYGGGTMADLGTLGGTLSYAYAINNQGQVAGDSIPSGGVHYHAFLYSDGKMSDLGTLGGDESHARGINNQGQVVGYSLTNYYGAQHAFLYAGGRMSDLNSLIATNSGWVLNQAIAINDSSQIVGNGWSPSAEQHAFLLTPIPSLEIRPAGTGVVLTWSTNAIAFGLFQTANLAPTNWVAVTNTPVVVNGQNQVLIQGPLAGNCFFRLQTQ